MAQIRFDGQVAVVTGAGGGLGKAYALFLASRGAKVVVNDLGGSGRGDGSGSILADKVVSEIKSSGGHATADYNNVVEGDKIIQTAINAYGRIDILINNAGILRDISFRKMTDRDWDLIIAVHLTGAYKCSRAAWPYFRKQRFGRIINTSAAAGLFGNFGQTNYSAGSRLTATVWTEDVLRILDPSWVVPLVTALVDKDCQENGSIFEVGGGHVAKYKWQRSRGAVLACDNNFTAGLLLQRWNEVGDFRVAEFSNGPFQPSDLSERLKSTVPNKKTQDPDFSGRVVLVTGGGAGLGRAYCLAFAKLGASVAVNDLSNAAKVAKEIEAAGGKAIDIPVSVEEGELIVKETMKAFGRIDIIINNAGILRDKAFVNMDDKSWHDIIAIHLRAAYKITHAAWPIFQKQKYGRVVNTTSTSGIYGNFGQANYAAGKAAVLGFSRALAREGAKYNIHVNAVAPTAYTNLTQSVMPPDVAELVKPDYVVPLVVLLCSDKLPNPTGNLYEAGGGQVSQTRWIRARGHTFSRDKTLTPEDVVAQWSRITDFSSGTDHPSTPEEGSGRMMAVIKEIQAENKAATGTKKPGQEWLQKIAEAKSGPAITTEFTYSARDVMLYNIGVGAKHDQLPFIFEENPDFQVIPTFGTTMTYSTPCIDVLPRILPNFNQAMMLHGEQYLEIRQHPIPTSATLISHLKVLEVIDKGAAAVVRIGVTSIDKATNRDVFYNEFVTFSRGSGGFGGDKKGTDRGAATAPNDVPPRSPDHVTEEKIPLTQAAIYRLSGDYNPLHVDPAFAAKGGFKAPILHGLCTFGMSGKAILERYGPMKSIKVRFAGTVLPGQTLVTEMWKEKNKVIFQTKVKETGKMVLAAAAVELLSNNGHSKL